MFVLDSIFYLLPHYIVVFQRVNNSNIRRINSVQAGVKAGDAKMNETHAAISSLTATSETFVESLNNLNKMLRKVMSNVQNVLNQLSVMDGRYRHKWINNIDKVIVLFRTY